MAGKPSHGHAAASSPTYTSWEAMRSRCNNPNARLYHNYGGRGIRVCERWDDFQNFLDDMGERPPGASLDRIDNDKGYEPENCKWSTRKEQAFNRRTTRPVTIDGVTHPISVWCRLLRRSPNTVWKRLKKGMTPEQALLTPHQPYRKYPKKED